MAIASSNSRIIQSKQISKQGLLDLISGEILALKIYPFVEKKQCLEWQDQINASRQLCRYSNAQDVPVNRIGMTLFETENDIDKIKIYLQEGQRTLSRMEALFGQTNPLQTLYKGLNEAWGASLTISQLYGKNMNPGIIRSFECNRKGGLPAHVDSLLKDLPNTTAFAGLQCQLAANLYFDVPPKGGELQIWDFEPDSEDLEALFNGTYDFIDTSRIRVQPHSLKPRVGELILFRSTCVHAVKASQGGSRSTASCFVGYYGKEQPLTVWA